MEITQAIRNALALDKSSPSRQRTVDITTVGARSGTPRRIEIWFHRVHGRWYLSSTPAKRDWYANLQQEPKFTFHLKHDVQADLPATAVPITGDDERRAVFEYIIDDLNQPHNPGMVSQPQRVDDWMAGSPLVEIIFDDIESDNRESSK